MGAKPLAGCSILVLDDERDSREILASIVEQAGAEVTMAVSVQDAIDAVASRRPNIVLSDISMPGQDGLTFIRAVRDHERDHVRELLVVAVTAHTRPSDRARFLSAGFDEHVAKPVDVAAIVTTLERMLSR